MTYEHCPPVSLVHFCTSKIFVPIGYTRGLGVWIINAQVVNTTGIMLQYLFSLKPYQLDYSMNLLEYLFTCGTRWCFHLPIILFGPRDELCLQFMAVILMGKGDLFEALFWSSTSSQFV